LKGPLIAGFFLPEESRTGSTRTFPLGEIWTPRMLVVNDRGLSDQLAEIAEVDDDGNVLFQQRFSGELAVDLVFREFLFDVQRLPI
jgi:hypothetical protein